jgi:tRNA(Ile)-lysidine synthase
MLKKFQKYITDNKLVNQEMSVLLAVSGGIDSMVMAHLFLESGFITGIAHCNFSLRGEESDKDEEMVSDFASERNIPFYSIRFDTTRYARSNRLSVQMAARELRYTWFEEIRKEKLYDLIAVGHNLNDNIETLLINLTRGTGICGLKGMSPSVNNIIRPLLFATREDIIEYCSRNNINFREDKSNADTKYTRNKIRLEVIPVLKEINPSIESTLSDTAARFNCIDEIVTDYINNIRKRISIGKDGLTLFNITLLKAYLQNATILYELFKPFSVNNAQLNDLIKVINGRTGGCINTSSYRIIKNRKELIISSRSFEKETYYTINDLSGFSDIPGIVSAISFERSNNFVIPSDSSVAGLDSEKISFPLIIRGWEEGDRFYPLGMNRKKKLSDYFTDNKYSRIDKEKIRILESGGRIVWLIGDRIDNRFRITDSTKKVFLIKTDSKGESSNTLGKKH